jgi:hypothetical protein
MNLLRIGLTVVNMDRVNRIDIGDGYVYLYFSAPLAQDFVRLKGQDVDALERWLLVNSEDITLTAPPAPPALLTNDEPTILLSDGDGHDFKA